MNKKLILWLALLGLVCCPSASSELVAPDPSWASTEISCYTVPITPTDWIAGPDGDEEEDSITDPVTIPLFDPDLGQLMQADITVENCVYQTAGFENLATTTARIRTETGAEIFTTLLDGSTQIVSVVKEGPTLHNLPAFDGEEDYGGTSGFSYILDECGTDGQSVIDPTAILAYIGAGETRELPTEASGYTTMSGSGNVQAQVITDAGANVCVNY